MITKELAIKTSMFYHVRARNRDGSAARARKNGQTKTWKRDPNRFRVPVKHGLRDTFYIEPGNAADWLVIDPTDHAAARAEYHLAADTPIGIVADRFRDDGLDAEADALLASSK